MAKKIRRFKTKIKSDFSMNALDSECMQKIPCYKICVKDQNQSPGVHAIDKGRAVREGR